MLEIVHSPDEAFSNVITVVHILLMRRLMVRVVEMMVSVSGRVEILAAAQLSTQVILGYLPRVTLGDTGLPDPKSFSLLYINWQKFRAA